MRNLDFTSVLHNLRTRDAHFITSFQLTIRAEVFGYALSTVTVVAGKFRESALDNGPMVTKLHYLNNNFKFT